MIGSKVTAYLLESVEQRVMITLHIGNAEIVSGLWKLPRFLPGGLRTI